MDTMNGTREASRVRLLLGKRGLRRVYSPCVVSSYFADYTSGAERFRRESATVALTMTAALFRSSQNRNGVRPASQPERRCRAPIG